MRPVRLLYLAPMLTLMHCASPQTQAPLQDAPLSISWQVLTHLDTPSAFSSALTLTNTSDAPIAASGWTLYFNFIRLIDAGSVSAQARITHINGDFYKLEPTSSFPVLEPGASTEITFQSAFWAVKKSDAPGGFYMVFLRCQWRSKRPATGTGLLRGRLRNAGPNHAVRCGPRTRADRSFSLWRQRIAFTFTKRDAAPRSPNACPVGTG